MGLSCCLCSNTAIGVGIALAVILLARWLLSPNYRRAPTRPARDASKRKHPRGTGPEMKCVSPSTGATLGSIRSYTAADVKNAEQAARIAATEGPHAWSRTSFEERRAVLQDILDWIVQNQEEIIDMCVRDSGKTVTEAAMGEVLFMCEKIRWTIQNGEKYLSREYRPIAALFAFTKQAYVAYRPLGVIGVIVPWNYPFQNVLSAAVPALMAGNGVVIKVSEYASFNAEWIEAIFRRVLAARGHDPELVQVVTGYGETGAALVSCGVDKVLFIGSPAVGKLVMRQASATLTPVILELGGKDPFIVFDDADFEHVIDIALRGAFINCGQNCISAERIFVQKGIYDKFAAEVTKRLKTLKQGATRCNGQERCDFGAITMPAQVAAYKELIADAVKNGARILAGGEVLPSDDNTKQGVYFQPTILSGVRQPMRIAQEETFGPVMCLLPFDSEEEVIRLANSTEFGLGSSVFTTDLRKAERVTAQLQTGMTTVNDFGMVPMVQSLPFGGIKSSGFGAFNGPEGLRGFSRTHAVVTDRFPMRTQTPKFLQYPQSPLAYKIAQDAVALIYGPSWSESIKALGRMIPKMMKA